MAGLDEGDPAGGRGWKPDSLASGVVLLLGLTLVQRAVGLLRGVLFCRWLDPDQLGQWDLAFGFLMLAAPAIVLGLPGSLGRYVEFYRRQGQLRAFLRRVMAATAILGTGGLAAIVAGRTVVARLVFNDPGRSGLVLYVAAGLGSVLVFHFLTSLFNALRQYRATSAMQMASSLVFAGLSLGLLAAWRRSAETVVLAFTAASGVTACVGAGWLARLWRRLPQVESPVSHRAVWARLAPFAGWLWLTNWLSNLFEITDRFMIVHLSGLPSAGALALVGQYHSARLVPVLFIGLAEMLAAMATPHLASDWEAGRKERVSRRLRLMIKWFGLAVLAGSAVFLVASPLLFGVAFQGKYAGGQMVLPWALISSIWTGLAALSYNYLWCAEKSRYVALVLAVGLGANIVLNLLLVPPLGLLGAVLGTAAARLGALALLWRITCRHGMGWDRGLVVLAALPLLLPLGPALVLVVTAATLLGTTPTARLFTREEEGEVLAACGRFLVKARGVFGPGPAASA